jgi:hypothetical protein
MAGVLIYFDVEAVARKYVVTLCIDRRHRLCG